MSDRDPDPPLAYRNAADDRDPARAARGFGGFVVGAAVMMLVGAILACGMLNESIGAPRHHLWQAGLFVVAAALAGAALFWPGMPAHRRRPFLIGLLAGVLVLSLVEGTCFYSP